MTKLLALSSSPRVDSNSTALLNELLRGLSQSPGNVQIDTIDLARLTINPCTQCDHCRQTGQCCINDDMQSIYNKLIDIDILVLACPIYYMAHCAQAKLFIDRCQVFWSRRHVLNQNIVPTPLRLRRGIFIATGATHGPKVFAGAKVTTKWLFESLNTEYWADLLVEGVENAGDILQDPTALKQAYLLGQRIACSE